MDKAMIDIVRFRMKSHSSMDEYSYNNQNQNDLRQDQQNNNRIEQIKKKKSLQNIPLINKNMNPIQKYIHEYKINQNHKYSRRNKQDSPLYDSKLQQINYIHRLYRNGSKFRKNNDDEQKTNPLNQSQIKKIKFKQKQKQLKELDEKCYVKYQSTSMYCTENRLEALQEAENQYLKLKNSITIPARNLGHLDYQRELSIENGGRNVLMNSRKQSNSSYVNNKSIQILNRRRQKRKINASDIEKQLKNAVIEQNGRKYFADLYLMKKQRDKIMNEIFKNNDKQQAEKDNEMKKSGSVTKNHIPNQIDSQGHLKTQNNFNSNNENVSTSKISLSSHNNNNNNHMGEYKKPMQFKKRVPTVKISLPLPLTSMSYEQKMRRQQQNFVQQKILKQRSEKKQKMLKGRNLNWNVYYEMLALKKTEISKLKKHCKFTQTYGEN